MKVEEREEWLKMEITRLENEVEDYKDLLRSIKSDLGSVMDGLIRVLPHLRSDDIKEVTIVLMRIRDIIRDIEKYA